MSTEPPTPIDVALAFHKAWTTGDVDAAAMLVAENVVLETPAGQLVGVRALKAFIGVFAATLTSSQILSAHGNDTEALITYATSNHAVASAPAAVLYRVAGPKIIEIRIIFERFPLAPDRGNAQPPTM